MVSVWSRFWLRWLRWLEPLRGGVPQSGTNSELSFAVFRSFWLLLFCALLCELLLAPLALEFPLLLGCGAPPAAVASHHCVLEAVVPKWSRSTLSGSGYG